MRSLILLLALAGCTGTEPDDTGDDGPVEFACGPEHAWRLPDPSYDALRATFETRVGEEGLQGASIAVMKDGVIVFAAAAGDRDPNEGLPMTVRTRSRNGSTLKMQTAAALLSLQDAEVLSVDDGIHDWLPGLELSPSPGHMDGVTLHYLISHQGGFYDYTPTAPAAEGVTAKDHAYGFFARNVFALVPAGSFWNYSNPNFSLAGLVASEAAQTDYDTLMQDAVFDPLCMSLATFDPEKVAADDWATVEYPDYEEADGALTWATPESFGHVFSRPAGLAWMSVLDLLHFQYFLMEGDDAVLSDATRAEIVTPQVTTGNGGGESSFYGYGMFLLPDGFRYGDWWYDAPMWNHNGGLPGYTTLVYTLPEQAVSVAVLQVGSGSVADVALDALLAETDLQPGTPREVPYDTAVLDAAAGTYLDPNNVGTIVVTRVDDTLQVEMPQLADAGFEVDDTLTWYGNADFAVVIDGYPYGVTFIDDDESLENGYRWFRNRIFVAERSAPQARLSAPSAPPRLDLPRLR